MFESFFKACVRRFLAQRLAKKRRWATMVLRQFIHGFMERNQTLNEANKKFLGFVRFQYLMRLTKQLPKSVMDKSWPDAPGSCVEVFIYSLALDTLNCRSNLKL